MSKHKVPAVHTKVDHWTRYRGALVQQWKAIDAAIPIGPWLPARLIFGIGDLIELAFWKSSQLDICRLRERFAAN